MADSMNFTLKDEPSSGKTLRGRVVKEGGSLEIYINGFGNAELPAGQGPVAALVLQDGHLRLVTLPTYDSPEHTTIDLDGAKAP